MIAVNSVTSNMPRFEMLKVPPENSSGLSLRSRARVARSFTSREISRIDLRSALRTTGTISPSLIATATPTCTSPWTAIDSAPQEALTAGNFRSARAAAFTIRSLKETFVSSERWICSRIAAAASMSISTVT